MNLATALGVAHAQPPDARTDEEVIKAIMAATTEAFSKRDARAWVQYCTADAQLVTVRGESMKGVAQIEKGLAAIFQTRARHATLKTLDVSVRLIRSDVALAHVTNELSGLLGPEGQTLPPHQELSIRVLVKDQGTWRITAFHNTILQRAGLNSAAQPTAAPIRRIDHIMIRADDPAKVYAFFTEVLQLPVAWPLMSPREGVATGGVGFGNVNVEAIRFPGQKGQPSRAHLLGFGFEPSPLATSLAELDRRGLTYGERRPLIATAQDGSKNTLWTNVTLRQFSDGEAADATTHVFLSEYSPKYVNVEERRDRLRTQLAKSGGGPLGVEGVKEVIVGVSDLETARGLWQKLLDPTPVSSFSTWQVGDGPAIRLVQAREMRLTVS